MTIFEIFSAMSADAVTSSRVYAMMKADIVRGRFPPRTLLVERALAEDYGASVTPIRNVAHQLVGERLLSLHPGGGYEIPSVTADSLQQLYSWHSQLIRMALNPKRLGEGMIELTVVSAENPPSVSEVAQAAENLFTRIAALSPNAEHRKAVQSAAERLHAPRRIEPTILNGTAEELAAVQALTAEGRRSDLVSAIWAYHRRRLRRVTELVAALNAAGQVPPRADIIREN